MRKYAALLLSLCCWGILLAQSPKREMRAVWLANVGIDWPRNKITSTGDYYEIRSQKLVMERMLDSIVSANMNTVCFHIRSFCDAMYESSYEPWSAYLVSERGMDPGYDPLAFVIEEGHKRGLEVHAWLNPYRFEESLNQYSGKPGDYRQTHPDWVLTYPSGYAILNPAVSGVIQRIKDIVGEVVNKYDVDGVLFDDYFYAYGGTPKDLDLREQELYKPADMDLGDWRRQNVDRMVAAVYDTIQQIKPYVTFGVAPFGIWTTDDKVAAKEGLTLPGGVSGSDMYAQIYCDPVAWLKAGTVDYISPQVYWPIESSQPYENLTRWWSEIANKFKRHMYASQTLENLTGADYQSGLKNEISDWKEETNINSYSYLERSGLGLWLRQTAKFGPEEIGAQIDINRKYDKNGAPGSLFFSMTQVYSTRGFTNYLRRYKFTQKAIPPAIGWKKAPSYGTVTGLHLTGDSLAWDKVENVRYTVYAIPRENAGRAGNFTDPANLLGFTYENGYKLPENRQPEDYTYGVAILDRYGNEYAPLRVNQTSVTAPQITLRAPENGERPVSPFLFEWETDSAVEYYVFELAEDSGFNTILYHTETDTNTFSSANLGMMEDGVTYYWRVRSRKAGAADAVSDVYSFIPKLFSLDLPADGSTDLPVTPVFKWSEITVDATLILEIATAGTFYPRQIVYSTELVSGSEHTIPVGHLLGGTTYYARIKVIVGNVSILSNVISFSTMELIPDIPVLTSPQNGSVIPGKNIRVTWQEEPRASGFTIELSPDPAFPSRLVKIRTVDAYTYEVTYEKLSSGTYYIRAKSIYSDRETGWCNVVEVSLDNEAGILSAEKNSGCFVVTDNNSTDRLVLSGLTGSGCYVRIFDFSGMLVQEQQVKPNGGTEISLPLEIGRPGVYLIAVTCDRTMKTIKYIRRK